MSSVVTAEWVQLVVAAGKIRSLDSVAQGAVWVLEALLGTLKPLPVPHLYKAAHFRHFDQSARM